MYMIMNGTKKIFLWIVILTILFIFAVPSSAQTKQASLVILENTQDLLVMFRFETEVVDINFISPTGIRYTKNSKNLEYSTGELWRTYRIHEAEAGEWLVEYDLNSNSEIGYSIVDENHGIWIQNFSIKETIMNDIEVSFRADYGNQSESYRYSIYIIEYFEGGTPQLLSTGEATSFEATNKKINLNNISDGTYQLLLKVEAGKEENEYDVFDSMTTSDFKFSNVNQPDPINSFSVYLDQSNSSLIVDWSKGSNRLDEKYRLKIYADSRITVPIYDGELDGSIKETRVHYPNNVLKLIISLEYNRNGVWSGESVKEIDLNSSEYLILEEADITNSNQIRLLYSVSEESILSVLLNDAPQYKVKVEGEGYLSLNLSKGHNDIYAEIPKTNEIYHTIESDIYFDAYPPEIILFDKLDGALVTGDSIPVIGKIKNGNELYINDLPISVNEEGEFNLEYPLESGENIIEISAKDVNQNGATQIITVYKKINEMSLLNLIRKYSPMLISIGLSFVLIIMSIVFLKSPTSLREKEPKKRQGLYRGIQIILFLGLGFSAYRFIFYRKMTGSIEFLGVIEKSIHEASNIIKLMEAYKIAFIGSAILILISVGLKRLFILKGPKS